ncbi:phage tail assembly chaperone [Fulvimarina pelagi]|uniref:phage tail assembly chaperone n=1 Tax=Fulvimarina pelagi TaxID=217511 RepID=UPI0011D0A7FB
MGRGGVGGRLKPPDAATGDRPAVAAFPWDDALRFGFGVLKLGAERFWALTPRELAAAFSAFEPKLGGFAPTPGDLDALMRRFPDQF